MCLKESLGNRITLAAICGISIALVTSQSSAGILGSGPDTFVFEYPQYDIKGKFNMFGTPYMLIDKPHNMFLQIGIQNGVAGLIIFVFIIGYLFNKGYVSLFKLKNQSYLWGYLSGISTYLITAFFDDSSVGVPIIFWTIFSCAVGALINERGG